MLLEVLSGLTEEFDAYRRRQARAWLSRVRGLRRRADALQAVAAAQREALEGVRGIDYAADGGGACSPDAIPSAVARMEAAQAECSAAMAELADEQRRALRALAQLGDPAHFELLALRYVACLEWAEVCARMGYAKSWAMDLHRAALLAAYDVMPPEFRDPRHPAV